MAKVKSFDVKAKPVPKRKKLSKRKKLAKIAKKSKPKSPLFR
jgi:hypothetical protein